MCSSLPSPFQATTMSVCQSHATVGPVLVPPPPPITCWGVQTPGVDDTLKNILVSSPTPFHTMYVKPSHVVIAGVALVAASESVPVADQFTAVAALASGGTAIASVATTAAPASRASFFRTDSPCVWAGLLMVTFGNARRCAGRPNPWNYLY